MAYIKIFIFLAIIFCHMDLRYLMGDRLTSYYTELYIIQKRDIREKARCVPELNHAIWWLFPHCFCRFNPTAGLGLQP